MHLIIATRWGEQWLRQIHPHSHPFPPSSPAGAGQPRVQRGFVEPVPASGKSYAGRPPVAEAPEGAVSGSGLRDQKSATQNNRHLCFGWKCLVSSSWWIHPEPGQGSRRTPGEFPCLSNFDHVPFKTRPHIWSQGWTAGSMALLTCPYTKKDKNIFRVNMFLSHLSSVMSI